MTREEAIKNIKEHCYFANLLPQAKEALDVAIKALEEQEPKTGECNTFELFQSGIKETWYECPKCKWSNALLIPRNYCPNCGAKMIEPRESEE